MRHHLRINDDVFRAHFNRKPFFLDHDLVGHPLFELERLVQLAHSLPPAHTEFNVGNLPVNQQLAAPDANGLSVEETIRRIEEDGSYLIIKWAEEDPEYRALLDELMDQIQALSEPLAPGMYKRACFIFLSSPHAVAPFHVDHEYNFLLQVRGTKTVHMWDPNDRFLVSDRQLEEHYTDFKFRYLPHKEEFDVTAWKCELTPGKGLHFPVVAPHYVRNGDRACLSFSITFRSEHSLRRELIYQTNARMRRLGLKPAEYGTNPMEDAAKLAAARTVRAARRLFGGRPREDRHY